MHGCTLEHHIVGTAMGSIGNASFCCLCRNLHGMVGDTNSQRFEVSSVFYTSAYQVVL